MGIASLSDTTHLESMIKRSGGVQGTIAGTPAWGHAGKRYVESEDGMGTLHLALTWKVCTARLPATPVGAAVVAQVDPAGGANQSYAVRSVQTDAEDEDGALSVLVLRRA